MDDLKVSYYGFVPDGPLNKWPSEVNLKTPFQELGQLMAEIGKSVMKKIGLIGPQTGISLDGTAQLGRMLYYRKSIEGMPDNPLRDIWSKKSSDNCYTICNDSLLNVSCSSFQSSEVSDEIDSMWSDVSVIERTLLS